jgi:hypothetical protein
MNVLDKVLVGIVVALFSVLATMAYQGAGAMSHADVEALVEKGEARHESKMDLVLDRLNHIEVSQARLEEKVDLLQQERNRHGR